MIAKICANAAHTIQLRGRQNIVNTQSWRFAIIRNVAFLATLIFLCYFDSAFGAANSRTFVPTGEEKQSLSNHLDYLDDPEGSYTIEQVSNDDASSFKPLLDTKPLGYKFKNKALWLRFAVDFKQYQEPYWFLIYDYEHIGNLTIYYPTATGFQTIQMDARLPIEGRQYNIREYLAKLPTPQSSPTYYYVRFSPDTRYFKVDLSWSGIKGTVEAVHNHELAYGLFFGGLLVMWLYNVALYIYLRDRAYLYYVYYLGCFTATFFYIYGFSPLVHRLNPFFEQIFAACGYGAIHGMVLFARHFLTLRKFVRWMDKYLAFSQWLLVIGGLLTFLQPIGTPFNYLNYLILLILPVLILGGIIRSIQGYAPARIYTFGWAIFGMGLGLLSLRSVGLLPANILTNHAVMVTSVSEAVIFAIALAYRIKLIEKEKNDALDEERSRLEHRVAERTESLQTALELRRMLLANVSHELRSPVNALRLLLDSTSNSNEKSHHDVISNVSAIAAHMSQLVENLLLLDVEQPATQNGPVQNFDLGNEIRATANLVRPLRQGSLATFSVDADHCDGVMIRGDVTSLRRIIINLLSNAFKFTESGSVSLHVDKGEMHGKVMCVIRVSDTGRGIPSSMHNQIFEPFVTSGTHNGHTGTGLGLAISRQLAINLGGSLRLVKSVENEGSEFECILFFNPASPKCIAPAIAALSKTAPRRLKILFAEDDPITAEAVQIIIRQLHHEVVHVISYADLQQALCETTSAYDVALIDHRLPGGYGLDAIRKCRNEGIAKTTRMILMTADVTPELLEAAKTICDDIVTKPTTAICLRQLLGVSETVEQSSATSLEIVDSGPLIMLKNCGAEHTALSGMCEGFHSAVGETLDKINKIISIPHGAHLDTKDLQEIVHRIRSSCATIGATSLFREFQTLESCENSSEAKQQYLRIIKCHNETQEALKILLSEIR